MVFQRKVEFLLRYVYGTTIKGIIVAVDLENRSCHVLLALPTSKKGYPFPYPFSIITWTLITCHFVTLTDHLFLSITNSFLWHSCATFMQSAYCHLKYAFPIWICCEQGS